MRTLMLLALAARVAAAPRSRADAATTDVIVTSGEAVVRRAPDRAFVTVTVETRAKNPRDAQRQNAEAMTAVQQRLTHGAHPEGRDPHARLRPPAGVRLRATARRVPREFVARNAHRGPRRRHRPRRRDRSTWSCRRARRRSAACGSTCGIATAVEREALRLAVADARGRAEAAAAGAGRAVDRVIKIEDARDGGDRAAAADDDVRDEVGGCGRRRRSSPASIEIRARVTLTASMK